MRTIREWSFPVLLIAVFFAGMFAIPAQTNDVPPSPSNSFYGDATGDMIIAAADIAQMNAWMLGLPYAYDTVQPQTATQDWNTSDVTSDALIAASDLSVINNWMLGFPVSIPDKPWALSNETLPSSIQVNTPTAFQINLASTSGTQFGRAGFPVIAGIDAANSTATGFLAGRTCSPVGGSRDQQTLPGDQCALSVTVTDWYGAAGPTKGLTETGTYGFSVTATTPGNLRIVFSISGNPPGLDIPGLGMGMVVAITGANNPPAFVTTAPTIGRQGDLYTYSAKTTDADAGNNLTCSLGTLNNCSGALPADTPGASPHTCPAYTFTPDGNLQSCQFRIVVTDNGVPALTAGQTTTVTINRNPEWSSQPVNINITQGSDYNSNNGTMWDVDAPAQALTCLTLFTTCGFPITYNAGGVSTMPCGFSFTAPAGSGSCALTLLAMDDGVPAAATASNQITIAWAPAGTAPVITSSAASVAIRGIEYTYNITATDDDAGQTITITKDVLDTCGGVLSGACSMVTPLSGCAYTFTPGTGLQTCVLGVTATDNGSPALTTTQYSIIIVTDAWTWMSGSDGLNQYGIYNTKGVPDPTNVPGARYGATSWTYATENLWLFGGFGFAGSGSNGYMNDLWKWDGTYWTWMSGSNGTNQLGYYGTKGVADSANVPGARYGSVTWTYATGNLWLFGGYGYSSSGGVGYLNDLWKWDGTYWTWISGTNATNQLGVYGTQGVPDSANVPGTREGAVSWKDASGNLWLFGGYGYPESGGAGYLNDLWKWDGTNWTWMSGSNAISQIGVYGTKGVADSANHPGSRYRGASWIDATGNLWLFGGWGFAASGTGYLNDLWKWDGTYWTWISGSNAPIQYGFYGTQGVPDPANVPGARARAFSWTDAAGNFWLFGGSGYASSGSSGSLNDLWKWDGTNWTYVNGSDVTNQNGYYGTKGVPSAANVPGSRYWGVSWIDATGQLWLFGGYGYSASGGAGDLNDLWRYNP